MNRTSYIKTAYLEFGLTVHFCQRKLKYFKIGQFMYNTAEQIIHVAL